MAQHRFLMLQSAPAFGAACAGALAVIALFGWQIDSEALKRVIPRSVPMNPVVAVMIILLAVGQLLAARAGLIKWIRLSCSLTVVLVAAIKLFDILTQNESGVDQQVLAAKIGESDPFYRNPMAPTTALGLLLLGAGALLADTARRSVLMIAATLGGMVVVMTGTAVVGFAADIQRLYEPVGYYPMALNTALAQLVLGAGLCVSAWPSRTV